jgi:hypothetical protein
MTRVGDLVGALVPPSAGGGDLVPISRSWPTVVGPVIARESWPSRIGPDGRLHVHVTSSLWASELTALAGDIADRLRAATGASGLRGIVFRVGVVPAATADQAAPVAAVPASPAATAAADELVRSIADPTLREAARRALERAIVRSLEPADSR